MYAYMIVVYVYSMRLLCRILICCRDFLKNIIGYLYCVNYVKILFCVDGIWLVISCVFFCICSVTGRYVGKVCYIDFVIL